MTEKVTTPKPTTEKHSKSAPPKTTTVTSKCDCVSPFQDKLYGAGMRVMNSTHNGKRCTVCSATH